MVIFKTFKFYVALLAIFYCPVSQSSVNSMPEQLVIEIKDTKHMLGRPTRIELYGVNLNEKISDINLDALNNNFGIIIDYIINDTTDKRWPKQKVQILKLKIYPRTTGNLSIPKIHSKHSHTKEKKINVDKGNTSIPSLIIPDLTPYEKQQFIVHVKLTSTNPNARLSTAKKLADKTFSGYSLPFKRNKKSKGQYELNIAWALTATKNGELTIDLPPIEYSVSGVLRKKLFLPTTKLNIRALPSYLPPTIPIGKISLNSELSIGGLLKPESTSYWNIKLSGNINNSYALPPIIRQIKSNTAIKYLPPNSVRENIVTANSFVSSVTHSIPFKALENGYLSLPIIKLRYFDPIKGKIITESHETENIYVLNLFWRTILSFVFLYLIFYMFKVVRKRWGRYKNSNKKKKQAIKILQSKTGNIKKAMQLINHAEYWPTNTSLQQWAELWKKSYVTNNDFDTFISNLSNRFYAPKNDNHNNLRLQLLSFIVNKKRIKKKLIKDWR